MMQMVLNAIKKQGAYLSACDGELLLALLTLCCLVIFQPGVALMEETDIQHKKPLLTILNYIITPP